MIWKEPIYDWRPIETWLDMDSGFPTHIVERVKVLAPQSLKENLRNGLLVVVKREEEVEDAVARTAASLAYHADLAIYSTASAVLSMHLERRPHPALDLSMMETLEQADLAVISGVHNLSSEGQKILDGLLMTRALPPSKVTVLLTAESGLPDLPGTTREFGKRIYTWSPPKHS